VKMTASTDRARRRETSSLLRDALKKNSTSQEKMGRAYGSYVSVSSIEQIPHEYDEIILHVSSSPRGNGNYGSIDRLLKTTRSGLHEEYSVLGERWHDAELFYDTSELERKTREKSRIKAKIQQNVQTIFSELEKSQRRWWHFFVPGTKKGQEALRTKVVQSLAEQALYSSIDSKTYTTSAEAIKAINKCLDPRGFGALNYLETKAVKLLYQGFD